MSPLNITVVGCGYVGMSLSVLLARYHSVVALDTDADRVRRINEGCSTVVDPGIEQYLAQEQLTLTATTDATHAYSAADTIIIATPTNYDPDTNRFDTSSVDSVIANVLQVNQQALVVIKSTVPVGYTRSIQQQYQNNNIVFSPEFLREGQALEDNLHPSRVIVGDESPDSAEFCELLKQCAKKRTWKLG